MLIAYDTMRCFANGIAHAYPLVLSQHSVSHIVFGVSPLRSVSYFVQLANTGGDGELSERNKEKL